MSLSLVEALSQVDLEAGRTYRCRVKDRMIELRVQEIVPPDLMATQLEESAIRVMLDPWVELPQPSGGKRVRGKPGKLPLPDVPEIPKDEEDS
jgi:hypothetical protein